MKMKMKKLRLLKRIIISVLSFAFALVLVNILNITDLSQVSAELNHVPAVCVNNSSGTLLNFKVEYGPAEISAGNSIVIRMTPSVSDKIKIAGFADNMPIYGTAGGVETEVGTRTYSYEGENNEICVMTVIFNGAYSGLNNVEGWYTASANIQYTGEVTEEAVSITVEINGAAQFSPITVPPGGTGTGPGGTDFTPGNAFGKTWRYGTNSGNEIYQDITSDGDYTKLKEMRWYINIGFSNLTNRDMRASGGSLYYTTADSLSYSNNNPTGSRYQKTAEEPYLEYWYWSGGNKYTISTDEPYHYDNAYLDDYLETGLNYGTMLCSPHDYIKDSVRIIRIIGRDYSAANRFINIADGNFLKSSENLNINEIYRHTGQSPFPGQRGLSLEEFFNQMKTEGQFSQYNSWEDIIIFDEVPSRDNPNILIPHFRLELGDLHFSNSYNGTVTGIKQGGAGEWDTVPARNLPYAYIIYYDTEATDLYLDSNSNFRYFNRVSLTYTDGQKNTDYAPLGMRYEASGGGGSVPAALRINKSDDTGSSVENIIFNLTGPGEYSQERITSSNGNVSFIINAAGEYTLTETTPADFNLSGIMPIIFTVTENDLNSGIVNLTDKLSQNYENTDDISFADGVNIIINYFLPDEPDEPEETTTTTTTTTATTTTTTTARITTTTSSATTTTTTTTTETIPTTLTTTTTEPTTTNSETTTTTTTTTTTGTEIPKTTATPTTTTKSAATESSTEPITTTGHIPQEEITTLPPVITSDISEPIIEPVIIPDLPTVIITVPTPAGNLNIEILEEMPDGAIPLSNGWFAWELDDSIWEIFDEDSIPLGLVIFEDNDNDWDWETFDFDNMIPLADLLLVHNTDNTDNMDNKETADIEEIEDTAELESTTKPATQTPKDNPTTGDNFYNFYVILGLMILTAIWLNRFNLFNLRDL